MKVFCFSFVILQLKIHFYANAQVGVIEGLLAWYSYNVKPNLI